MIVAWKNKRKHVLSAFLRIYLRICEPLHDNMTARSMAKYSRHCVNMWLATRRKEQGLKPKTPNHGLNTVACGRLKPGYVKTHNPGHTCVPIWRSRTAQTGADPLPRTPAG